LAPTTGQKSKLANANQAAAALQFVPSAIDSPSQCFHINTKPPLSANSAAPRPFPLPKGPPVPSEQAAASRELSVMQLELQHKLSPTDTLSGAHSTSSSSSTSTTYAILINLPKTIPSCPNNVAFHLIAYSPQPKLRADSSGEHLLHWRPIGRLYFPLAPLNTLVFA